MTQEASTFTFVFPESGLESLRPSNTPASRGSPAPGTEGGSSADLSSSLSQSTEDVSQDMVGHSSTAACHGETDCLWGDTESLNGDVLLLQSSVLLLILSGTACTMEAHGENQVVAVEVQNLSPVQMGNVRVSDLLAGLIQGKIHRFQTCSSLLLLTRATSHGPQKAMF